MLVWSSGCTSCAARGPSRMWGRGGRTDGQAYTGTAMLLAPLNRQHCEDSQGSPWPWVRRVTGGGSAEGSQPASLRDPAVHMPMSRGPCAPHPSWGSWACGRVCLKNHGVALVSAGSQVGWQARIPAKPCWGAAGQGRTAAVQLFGSLGHDKSVAPEPPAPRPREGGRQLV